MYRDYNAALNILDAAGLRVVKRAWRRYKTALGFGQAQQPSGKCEPYRRNACAFRAGNPGAKAPGGSQWG